MVHDVTGDGDGDSRELADVCHELLNMPTPSKFTHDTAELELCCPIGMDILNSDLYASTMRNAHAIVAESHRDVWTSAAFLRDCDSPLEAAWRVWWAVATNARHVDMPLVLHQYKVRLGGKSYRLDVAMFTWRGHAPVLAVELDGHTYHERTPEQVAERNTRDRALQTAGWVVLHYSYSEIVTRGLECAIEALERFDAIISTRPRRTA